MASKMSTAECFSPCDDLMRLQNEFVYYASAQTRSYATQLKQMK